jgi:EREBP-like factor
VAPPYEITTAAPAVEASSSVGVQVAAPAEAAEAAATCWEYLGGEEDDYEAAMMWNEPEPLSDIFLK